MRNSIKGRAEACSLLCVLVHMSSGHLCNRNSSMLYDLFSKSVYLVFLGRFIQVILSPSFFLPTPAPSCLFPPTLLGRFWRLIWPRGVSSTVRKEMDTTLGCVCLCMHVVFFQSFLSKL